MGTDAVVPWGSPSYEERHAEVGDRRSSPSAFEREGIDIVLIKNLWSGGDTETKELGGAGGIRVALTRASVTYERLDSVLGIHQGHFGC